MKVVTYLRLPAFVIGMSCSAFANPRFEVMLDDLLEGSVDQITTDELAAEMISNEEKPTLLDTRSEKEFATSHLDGALRIGYLDFSMNHLKDLNRNAPLVVYCSIGKRSEMIGKKLQSAGFTNVRNLRGGIFQWANDGRSLVDAKGPTKTVHSYNRKWAQWLDAQVPSVR